MTLNKPLLPQLAKIFHEHQPLDCPGVLFVRKRRGRKLQFMMGGCTLRHAAEYVRWDGSPPNEFVFFFDSDATGLVGLVRPLTEGR